VNRFRTSDVAAMLRRRIQWGVHLGLVKPGDRLPSLRAAAAEFDVDQRSVLAAYRDLEREGMVEMRPRSGIYVASDPHAPAQLPQNSRWMSEMFLQGFSRGVPPVALGNTLSSAMSAASLTAACVECNADQILWMATQLRHEFGMSTTWIEVGSLSAETIAERLRASNLIVTTSFHAADAYKLGEEFGLPVVVATIRRDDGTQQRAELGRGPVYFIGTDERYAQKLLDASDSARWMSNVRPLTLDRLKTGDIPDDAPVVVTQAVANILGDNLPRGATVVDYPFSNESRTEIIAVMLNAALRANEGKPQASDPQAR
jgi:DNA-binding GntR family transcriptional regulator